MPKSVNATSASGLAGGPWQEGHHADQRRQDGQQRPRHGEKLQRRDREAGHEIEIEADEPVQRILRVSHLALFVGDFDFHRVSRERVTQRRHVGADFQAAIDGVDNVAIVTTQHTTLSMLICVVRWRTRFINREAALRQYTS